MPHYSEEASEAELVRQALLEQERWEAAAASRSSTGTAAQSEVTREPQPEPEDQQPDEYKQRLLAAAAEEAVPPVRASELSARLAQGSQLAANAAAEIATRLAAARSQARSAHATHEAVKKRSDETMAGLKDRADTAKSSALAAVAAHEDAAAEVRQAGDEVEHARMLADAAAEVLALAKQETEAARASVPDGAAAAPDDDHELVQLERDVARSTAAAMASKAAHSQAQSAAARGADTLEQLRAEEESAMQAASLRFDAEDLETRALHHHRREELDATLTELRDQASKCEAQEASARAAASLELQGGGHASELARQSAARRTKAKAEAMDARAKAADIAVALADAEAAATRLMDAADDSVDSPGTVRARAEGAVEELRAQVEDRERAIGSLLSAVEAGKSKVAIAKMDLDSAQGTARELAETAAAKHQKAIAAHEAAYQRSRSAQMQLTGLEQQQAQAQAAAMVAQGRLQAAHERLGSESDAFADEAKQLIDVAIAAKRTADEATAHVSAMRENLAAAEVKESTCRAAAEAAANEAAASRLESATSDDDDITVQSLRTACITADQFLKIRQSRLDSAEDAVRRLEASLQEARQAFAAATALAHSPRTEQAERTAAQKKKEAARAEKLAELKQLQAKRAADAVLQFLDDAESVTLVIQYNPFHGQYNEQKMLERLKGIGAPDGMARGVSSWLMQGAAEIKGPLRKARAIMNQLQAVDSLNVGIAPTAEQIASGRLQAQRTGVDIRGVPGAEELALERELSHDEDSDDSDTDALLDAVLVSDTKKSLTDAAQQTRLASVQADRSAAEAAAASSEARWGAAASAYEDQQQSPTLAPAGNGPEDDPAELVDRMSALQAELDGAERLAELAREEFAEHSERQAAAHAKLDAAVQEKEAALEAESGAARARVVAADLEAENAIAEREAAGHALSEAVMQEATAIEELRRAEDEAASAKTQLEHLAATSEDRAEAQAGVAACADRLEALKLQASQASAAVADAEQAEQRAMQEDGICLAHRVSAEVVGRSLVEEVDHLVGQATAQLQEAQRAVQTGEMALSKAKDDFNAAGARVTTDVSVAMSIADERKAAAAAQDKVDVLRQTVAMAAKLAEQRSAAADIAEQEFELAAELEATELKDAQKGSEDAAKKAKKYSDKLVFLREEIEAAEKQLEEWVELESGPTGQESEQREDLDRCREAIAAAEADQTDLEHRASEAAEQAAAAEQTLRERKAQLEQQHARPGTLERAALAHAEAKETKAEEMLKAELAHVDAERERLGAAEAAEARAVQQATLKKAEASRTAEGALAELSKAREATLLSAHDCQAADETVSRLESSLQQAEALARAARENEDEARALAIASPGTGRHGTRDGGGTVDDSWADLTVYESAAASEPYGETTHYVHRTDSGGTTLRLSSPAREPPARKTTISFGPDRFDDEEPPSPKWVPASTGGGSSGNPDYGLVSTHAHATGSARSASAEVSAMDASALRPPSPEIVHPPATRSELHAESVSKANPYTEPWTVHQKGHHLNRAHPSPQRRRPAAAAPRASLTPQKSRPPSSDATADPYSEPWTVHQKRHHLNRARPSKRQGGVAGGTDSEATFQRLSSPSRVRHTGAPASGSFAHPEDYMGDTHGHTFSEAMARQHSSFKRKPAAPPDARGATMRLHKNEESLYELKDRIEGASQPRYMEAVEDSERQGKQAAQDRERRKADAEAKRIADEFAAEEALKLKAQAVAVATLKGQRKLGVGRKKAGGAKAKPIWKRTEEQLERRKQLLAQAKQKEEASQEQVDSQAKWGADIGRLWACVNVLHEQLALATALFEQVTYEVRTGQDQTGEASPRGKMRLQEAFEDICEENSGLTLHADQRAGLFRVLNHRGAVASEEAEMLMHRQQEMERDAFYQLCYHHHGLVLEADQCDQLLDLVLSRASKDEVVQKLTATFEEGALWSAAVNKMAARTHKATRKRWDKLEGERNARIAQAKREKEEEIAATLLEAPELKNSFAKRASTPVDTTRRALDSAELDDTEGVEAAEGEAGDEQPERAVRRKPARAKKKKKPQQPWEVQGYRGDSVEKVGRSRTPQRRPARDGGAGDDDGSSRRTVAPSPPRVYGLHTQVSEEKSTQGALEAELLRQAEWRERTVPNLSRSFASVAELAADSAGAGGMSGGVDAEASGVAGEGSPTLSVASTATSTGSLIPPESQLPKSVAQLVVKLRSLSYGTSGQDPVKLFRHYDRNNRGGLDQREFGLAVRKGGALTRSQMSDTELRLLFRAVDKDGDGFISMDELRAFVWGGEDVEAEAIQLVESRRHKSEAAAEAAGQRLPLTVHSFAPPPSPMMAAAGGAGAGGRPTATPRRASSPKPLHER
jgi:hypothetical protein